jgi:hypothetical protein
VTCAHARGVMPEIKVRRFARPRKAGQIGVHLPIDLDEGCVERIDVARNLPPMRPRPLRVSKRRWRTNIKVARLDR